jgi:hypothetical protein
MIEPLNSEGPTADEVITKLTEYLAEPIMAEDASWPAVTGEDTNELGDLIWSILEAKFQRDCDNDMVMEFAVSRRNRGTLHTFTTPHNATTDEDRLDVVRTIESMGDTVARLTKRLAFEYEQRILVARARHKTEPVALVASILDGQGHRTMARRLTAWIETLDGFGPGTLYVGLEDDLWAPLGVTTADLKEAVRDNYNKRDGYINFMVATAEKYLEENK